MNRLFFTSLAAGLAHTCGILEGGGVLCWGKSHRGQAGEGGVPDDGYNRFPVPIQGLKGPAIALALGAAHSCARLKDGRVKCWGVRNKDEFPPAGDDLKDMWKPVEISNE